MFKEVPNLEKNCYQCQRQIIVKYIYPKKTYSNKNNWEWWTEDKKNEGKFICDNCLLNLYNNKKTEYLRSVKNATKRNTMRNYICKIRGNY